MLNVKMFRKYLVLAQNQAWERSAKMMDAKKGGVHKDDLVAFSVQAAVAATLLEVIEALDQATE